MPRFFFHLHDRGTIVADEEGQVFSSLDAAVEQARLAARGLLAAEVSEGKLCLGCHIEVEEEPTGRVFVVPFSAAVRLDDAITERLKAG